MKRLHEGIGRVETIVAGIFLVLMVLSIFTGGVARSLGHPLNWTIDAATCLFAWSCFLSADLAWRRNGLMALEIVTNRLSPEGQRYLRMLNYAIIMAFLLFLFVMGFYLSWVSRARSFNGIPWVSYSLVTMSLVVGSLLLLFTTTLKVAAELRGEGRPEGVGAADIL